MGDPAKKARRKAGAGARPPTVLVAFRVTPALAERLDKLAAELSTPWHEMKRSAVARAAMERGLDGLEQETAPVGRSSS
jgi:hypothetical protein